MKLSVGSLFSGIGGIEYGLERTGHFQTIWHSEIDPWASAVLAKHWPAVENLGDITKIDWTTVKRPDVLVGGFPCQDISQAGGYVANANRQRVEGREEARIFGRSGQDFLEHVRRRNKGDGGCWESDTGVLRVAHGVPNRIHRIKCVGNAVVPQVAQSIGEAIARFEEERKRAEMDEKTGNEIGESDLNIVRRDA